jgi:hypothetical protein
MGEVIAFPTRDRADGRGSPPETVFENRGWRILELPRAGRFVAVSSYCRRGIEVGRFDPRASRGNYHEGTEIAVLTRCGRDERLARCAIAWINSGGPRTVILASFVVAAANRFQFWRDAIIEVAVIGGVKLVRLVDGSIAIARGHEPVPLLDPFAPIREHRRRAAFDRLSPEMRAAVMRWADPRGQFGKLLEPLRPH